MVLRETMVRQQEHKARQYNTTTPDRKPFKHTHTSLLGLDRV